MKTRKKMSWKAFALRAGVLAVVIIAGISYASDRYRLAPDPQEVRCFPDHSLFLVDLYQPEPVRGAIMAYSARGLDPFFEDGTLMAKVLVGKPGDSVVVNASGLFVNGDQHAESFPLAAGLGRKASDFFREETIPEDHYLMMAPAPESYDGRYWGYITRDQLVGLARPIR